MGYPDPQEAATTKKPRKPDTFTFMKIGAVVLRPVLTLRTGFKILNADTRAVASLARRLRTSAAATGLPAYRPTRYRGRRPRGGRGAHEVESEQVGVVVQPAAQPPGG